MSAPSRHDARAERVLEPEEGLRAWRRGCLIAFSVAFVPAAIVLQCANDAYWSQQVGEPCESGSDCRSQDYCFEEGYCTTRCDDAGECPEGWSCRIGALYDDSTARRLGQHPDLSSGICLRP